LPTIKLSPVTAAVTKAVLFCWSHYYRVATKCRGLWKRSRQSQGRC